MGIVEGGVVCEVQVRLCARCGAPIPRRVLAGGRLERPVIYGRRKYCGNGCAQTKACGPLLAEIARHLEANGGDDGSAIPGAQSPVIVRRRKILVLVRQALQRGDVRPTTEQLAEQCGVADWMIQKDCLCLKKAGAWPKLSEVERAKIALERRRERRKRRGTAPAEADAGVSGEMIRAFRAAAARYEAVRTRGNGETDLAHAELRYWVVRISRTVGASACRYGDRCYLPSPGEDSFVRVRASDMFVPRAVVRANREEADAAFDAAYPGLAS